MKWVLKYYSILLLGNVLRAFFSIFPIKGKTIVFISFTGEKISCNPYYLYRYMKNRSDYDMYWVVKNIDMGYDVNTDHLIINKGYRYLKLMFTAGFIVTNDRLASYLLFRKGQVLINTWHGGGAFKRTFGYPKGIIRWYKDKTTLLDSKRTSLFLSSSRMWSEVIARNSFLYEGDILPSGYPRNDIFFKEQKDKILIIKKSLSIPIDNEVILYAPTYRNGSPSENNIYKSIPSLDVRNIKKGLYKKTGREITVLFRGHHAMRSELSVVDTIDVSTYPDMQELLLIADVLISDYSSCLWDYSLTKRPCFIYAPDFEDYLRNPGFESDFKGWPFIICKDNTTLIRELTTFNQEEYSRSVDRYLTSYGSYEKGHASEQVFNWIEKHSMK